MVVNFVLRFVPSPCTVAMIATRIAGNVAMMLAGPTLRTVPVTTHLPFHKVPEHLSAALIETHGEA